MPFSLAAIEPLRTLRTDLIHHNLEGWLLEKRVLREWLARWYSAGSSSDLPEFRLFLMMALARAAQEECNYGVKKNCNSGNFRV